MSNQILPQTYLENITHALNTQRGGRSLSPNETVFLCLAHDDHNPSANWNPVKGVWHCHACGSSGGAYDLGDLLGIARPERQTSSGSSSSHYSYQDADGKEIFQVVRGMKNGEKTFSQRHYNPSHPKAKPDGWAWTLEGIQRVPYRLPQILEALKNAQTIFIVEGEKDVDTLERMGHVATCNSGGAVKWRDEYSDTLRGADVVVLPDNDKAGRDHCTQVLKSLEGKAKSARVLDLPNLPEKGDVTDWKNQGGTFEQFEALLENALSAAAWLEQQLNISSDTVDPFTLPKGMQMGTDAANSHILARAGVGEKLKYILGLGWYTYHPDTGTWQQDKAEIAAVQIVEVTLRRVVGNKFDVALNSRAPKEEVSALASWAKSVGDYRNLSSCLKLAAGKPEFLTLATQWDSHPHLLNCQNGVLELKTGVLHPHSPNYLLTHVSGAIYDPNAEHPTIKILLDLLEQDGRRDFLQRAVGSTLFGENPNEKLTVFEGFGGTGKGTLVRGVLAMLGDYAHSVEVNTLLASSHGESAGTPRPDLLAMRGKRLVVAGEPPKGSRFNEGRVKGMTGNDPITARTLHSPVMVTFDPVFKLWIHTNFPIAAGHDDTGMKRRMTVVPFLAKPEIPDPTIKSTIQFDQRARSALLNWALEGFSLWFSSGFDLKESENVKNATEKYWKSQDFYSIFIEQNLVFGADQEIKSAQLSQIFKDWQTETGQTKLKISDLHNELRVKGATPTRTKEARKWVGVGLKIGDAVTVGDTSNRGFSLNTRVIEKTPNKPVTYRHPSPILSDSPNESLNNLSDFFLISPESNPEPEPNPTTTEEDF